MKLKPDAQGELRPGCTRIRAASPMDVKTGPNHQPQAGSDSRGEPGGLDAALAPRPPAGAVPATPAISAPDGCIIIKTSAIHGLGAFARHDLSRSTRVIEYLGEIIDKLESLRRQESGNPFLFCLDDQCDLDGMVAWNAARYLNHSCAPNCDAERIDGKIWITARRDLQAGEELTFNYGYDLENYRDYPCHCGAINCRKYMVAEEFFDQVRPGPDQVKPSA